MYGSQSDDNLQYDAPALPGNNGHHYMEAFAIADDFCKSIGASIMKGGDGAVSVPLANIDPAPENTLKPLGDHLCFYSDLLGFSSEMESGGIDSLPDFYGAAYYAASEHPLVRTYLLSDSYIAFAVADQADELVALIQFVISQWRSDGLMPRSSIGFGTFVERKPNFGGVPPNFFGVQIAGTALVDAANMHKSRPLGSRTLVSPAARQKLESISSARLAEDVKGTIEVFLEPYPVHGLFDCLYYLLCLRDFRPGTHNFDHYVWSIASRAYAGGDILFQVAMNLCPPDYEEAMLNTICDAVWDVLRAYRPVAS